MWGRQRKPAFERAIATGISLLLLLSSCSGGDAAERAIVVEESPASLSQSTPTRSEDPGSDSISAEAEAEPLTEEELLLAAAEQQLKEQADELGMRHTADFWFIDLDLPADEREWRQKTVYSDVPIDTKDINQVLWLTRTRLYSEDYPVMAVFAELESPDDTVFYDVLGLDFCDAAFPPTQEHLSNFISNYWHSLRALHIGVVVTVNGQSTDAVPRLAQYDFADLLDRHASTVHTASELFATQQRPTYHPQPLWELENRPKPYYREEDVYADSSQDWSDLPEALQQELTDLFLPEDPVLYALNQYLFQVIPQGYMELTDLEFDDPRELKNSVVQRIAMRLVNKVDVLSDEVLEEDLARVLERTGAASREDLFILAKTEAEISDVYRMWARSYVVTGEHLERTVERIFGQEMPICHGSMGDRTWGYHYLSHCYSHFPGGTGDGYGGGRFPVVLDYSDEGDHYRVTAAFYLSYLFEGWQGIEIAGEKDEYGMQPSKAMTVYNAVELIRGEAPRAEIRLDKGGEDGLIFAGFHYIGHTY